MLAKLVEQKFINYSRVCITCLTYKNEYFVYFWPKFCVPLQLFVCEPTDRPTDIWHYKSKLNNNTEKLVYEYFNVLLS